MSSETLDFSGLFKLETLMHLDVVNCAFYEVGLQKLIAVVGEETLEYLHINSDGKRTQKKFPWDFKHDPIRSLCFEPSGTWLLTVTDTNIAIIPYLPIFDPNANYDHKWSLTDPTILPFVSNKSVSIVWWLTKSADNIAIIALQNGNLLFYSLDTNGLLGEIRVNVEILEIQICVDDSLDVIVLLVTSVLNQHLKLVLEHRSINYNWLNHLTSLVDTKEKKDGIIAYLTDKIDKISTLGQGSSDKDTLDYSRVPVEYLPIFRRGSQRWVLTPQNVNGRHFITAFDVKTGTVFCESTEEPQPSRTFQPCLARQSDYIQALWCHRLLFLLTDNSIEVHSASFSTLKDSTAPDTNPETCLWKVELPSRLRRGYLLSPRAANRQPSSWQPPTFLCDLQLPRFPIEPCLVVGHKGIFLLTTMWDACEWLVGVITRGGRGAERCAAALEAPLPCLLTAAADMLLARGKVSPAKYLYTLSRKPVEPWFVRLGVFGMTSELASLRTEVEPTGTAAAVKILAQILQIVTDPQPDSTVHTTHPNLTLCHLKEICHLAASLGLWEVLSAFSIYRGSPQLALNSIDHRRAMCKGTLKYLLRNPFIQMYLLEADLLALYEYIEKNCASFDDDLIKRLCVWFCPLSQQLRPPLRDLRNGVENEHTRRLEKLIGLFTRLASELDRRLPSRVVYTLPAPVQSTKEEFIPHDNISCGLQHWALVCGREGEGAVVSADCAVKTSLIGRVQQIACGRHHNIILTENGVYASGDNSHGQLGVGRTWRSGWGERATAGGACVRVRVPWPYRVEMVAAGQYHSAAVDIKGYLFTWGWGIHGQLGHGNTNDALVPKLVTALLGYKVRIVGCGACHTVVLLWTGQVFAFGSSTFGQLGSGNQNKSTVPIRVSLPPICNIAVGYFHNLALGDYNKLYQWGASPQSVRVAVPRREEGGSPPAQSAPPAETAPPAHLSPALVPTDDIYDNIQLIAAGWHHSCLLTSVSELYTWGLNFDGQLGRGDRKHVCAPARVEVQQQGHRWNGGGGLLGAGGDYTVYVDRTGRVFFAGQMREEKIITVKTTKRILKIPSRKANNFFRYICRIQNIVSPIGADKNISLLELRANPIARLSDFDSEHWLDSVIHELKPWIQESDVGDNKNFSAKLALHNKKYSECVRLQLENLKSKSVCADRKAEMIYKAPKSKITTVIKNRLKEIGLAYLNKIEYPTLTESIYASLPCSCDESASEEVTSEADASASVELTANQLASRAAKILDESLTHFPASYDAWDRSLMLTKEFFIENGLPGTELEAVLNKYVESNANLVSSAVFCSDESATYEKLFTPKFYLSVCSKLLDTSG